MTAIPREVELKYRVRDPKALREWIAAGFGGALVGVTVLDVRTTLVEDRYVDTLHGAIARSGFGARLRRGDNGNVTLTVKSLAHDRAPSGAPPRRRLKGLSQRMEVEGPASERLDPAAWPPSPAQELVDELRGAGRLRTLFVIRQRREGRTLALEEGHLLVTLDEVAVLRGGRAVGAFHALEIEAGDGHGGGLERVAALLEASGLVDPETRSKEEIGREMVEAALRHPEHRLPRVPRTPGIRPDDTLALAGRKVLRMHLARMLSYEAGTRSGEDPEDLHKMRVATRRVRAAWRVFDGAYRPRLVRRYVRELREAAATLGEVRDMDVLLEGLAAYVTTLPDAGRDAMEPLRASWAGRRDAARGRLLALLDSRQYHDFVEDYLDFVETPGAGERPALAGEPVLVRDTAGSRILAAYERVHAYETTMAWADIPTLHALRIEGKRLRYTLEYFGEVLPPSASGLIGVVTAMQDHLGLLNDAHVSATMTRAWLNVSASQLDIASRRAVGLYLDSREAEMQRLRRGFRPLWRRITGPSFRRTLGLAIAAI
jgi:triphosphatase